jgi:hypothetical protein
MAVAPVVRYGLLCDDWQVDPTNQNRVHIIGLMSFIRATDDPPYPLLYREICVFLALTEGRGSGHGFITGTHEETGETVFETPRRPITFGVDPLDVTGIVFRIRDCWFPRAGLYSIQFWYDGVIAEQRPLLLR